jgi:GT2 family glycosyltransferase
MKISVVVCSVNRPAILHDTVISIVAQDQPISEVLIVCPSKKHILQATLETPGVRFVLGPLGLPAQRNAGLETIDSDCDLVAFFDDDIELCTSYLKNIAALFAENPDIRIASGKLLRDGGRCTVVTREQARALCWERERNEILPAGPVRYVPSNSAYGCNMIVRHAAINKLRFDEGLPLYAWLEDRDYSHRITKNLHPPVECQDAVAVHLGARSGRIGGVRMGFSEIINPVYLWVKNKTFSLPYIVVQYWMRCLLGNILGILTRDSEYDRIGLLKGNLLGLEHLLCGRCDPAHVSSLPPNDTRTMRPA